MNSLSLGNVAMNSYINPNYVSSTQNERGKKTVEPFSEKIVRGVSDKKMMDLAVEKYPGDVTIAYPPSLNISPVSEKPKNEMTLDEYKQSIMNKIAKFPVSGWARTTFASGTIVIKEEAFERMKADPSYEKFVLDRVSSACSVRGIPVGANSAIGYDVIGASPEECYGYAGPIGKSGVEVVDNKKTWWKKRRENNAKMIEEQMKKNQMLRQIQERYRSQVYSSQRWLEILNRSEVESSYIFPQSLKKLAISAYEKL